MVCRSTFAHSYPPGYGIAVMMSTVLNLGRAILQSYHMAILFISALSPVLVYAQYPDSPAPGNFIRRAHSRGEMFDTSTYPYHMFYDADFPEL